MKAFTVFMTTLLVAINVLAQVNYKDGYAMLNPVDKLEENECVFKHENIPNYQGYKYIVNACDSRHISTITLRLNKPDRLDTNECVYNIVQKMSGRSIFRVVQPCQERNEVPPAIPQDNIADEEIMAMPPAPEEKAVQKPIAKKKTSSQPVVTNENVDKVNEATPEIKNYIPPAVDQDF